MKQGVALQIGIGEFVSAAIREKQTLKTTKADSPRYFQLLLSVLITLIGDPGDTDHLFTLTGVENLYPTA